MVEYSKGPQNIITPDYQVIRLSEGCPHKCISGNTYVNTIEGNIKIKELVGREIGVYTYDQNSKEVFITKAINIRKIGSEQVIRIGFDDHSYIDCTNNHLFLTFKNGNQFVNVRETPKKGGELSIGESVRAFHFYNSSGYCDVFWGRHKSQKRYRLVMEYVLGRKLNDSEVVHHIDYDKYNDHPGNLRLCANQKEHYSFHPEISKRMIDNNPCVFNTAESYKKMADKIRGIKRSDETRLRVRESKLGDKNPNYKHGLSPKTSRIKEINHKVVSIEYIGIDDVYDLEVPVTGWYFANGVLVHNCAWCREHVEIGDNWNIFDIPEIVRRDLRITDMNLLAKPEALEIINQFRNLRVDNKVVYPWLVCGVDYRFLTPEIAQALKDNRFVNLHIAWDWRYSDQKLIKKAIDCLKKAGHRKISIFMICNHGAVSYKENVKKLNLCKYWGVQAADCYFDNQVSPNIEPIGWDLLDIKRFRKDVRRHNQIVNFGIDVQP